MAQRVINGEQYEATLIGGDLDGSPLDVEGEVAITGLQGASIFPITPNDSTDLTSVTTALYVGTTGDIELICANDTSPVVLQNVLGGSFLPLKVKRVVASGTTASGIIGIL